MSLVPILVPLALSLLPASDPAASGDVLAFEERVVAGGPEDFLEVHYLRLAGTQREIGRKLAEIARERHGWGPSEAIDPRRTRAQRAYFERNAPLFLERMRGVADAYGCALEDDRYNLASLSFGFAKPGCTVVYYPPEWTVWGTGVVSRNFDFTTGTFQGRRPGAGEVSVCGRPYVVETHPDEGYASLSVCAFDLLGGVVDGINSEGLTIALLADDEVSQRFDVTPAKGPQAGFGVIQIGRHLLETCATVEEAQQALLEAKLYYTSIPCHYLVADRHGRSFVWENSVSMTQGFVIEGDGAPQATTNYMQHLHPDPDALPEESYPNGSFNRHRAVMEHVRGRRGEVDLELVKEGSARVAACNPAPAGAYAPGRTLWHALYFPEERRLEVDFYLGENVGSEGIRRSGYQAFELRGGSRSAEAAPRVGSVSSQR